MTEGWRYVTSRRAEQDLRRLSADNVRRVLTALENLVAHPEQADIRKLQGRTEEWRLRVGDVRIRYRPDRAARTYVVLRVLPRGRAYRGH